MRTPSRLLTADPTPGLTADPTPATAPTRARPEPVERADRSNRSTRGDPPLSPRQKSALAQIARRAWREGGHRERARQASAAADPHGIPDAETRLFDTWRRAEALRATRVQISDARNSHYRTLANHFSALARARKPEVSDQKSEVYAGNVKLVEETDKRVTSRDILSELGGNITISGRVIEGEEAVKYIDQMDQSDRLSMIEDMLSVGYFSQNSHPPSVARRAKDGSAISNQPLFVSGEAREFAADRRRQGSKIQALLIDNRLTWAYADGIARQMYRLERVEWCRSPELQSVITALIKHLRK